MIVAGIQKKIMNFFFFLQTSKQYRVAYYLFSLQITTVHKSPSAITPGHPWGLGDRMETLLKVMSSILQTLQLCEERLEKDWVKPVRYLIQRSLREHQWASAKTLGMESMCEIFR